MHNTKISVIVPIYNVEAYLGRCLDSLINQTLKEIEIICIDDCSTDSSLTILKEYSKKDIRIKCIELEKNSGLGVARNAGLDMAEGVYINYVDSDDWLDLDCLEICYNYLLTHDLDVLYFGTRYVWSDSIENTVFSTNAEDPVMLDSSLVLEYYLENLDRLLMMISCNKVYKRIFLISNTLKFFNIFYEDNDYSFRVHYYAKKYMLIPNVFYNYYQRNGSIAKSLTPKHANDTVKSITFIKDFLVNKNEWDKYAELVTKYIIRVNVAAFSRRIIYIDNDWDERVRITNIWLTKLNESSILTEMLYYLSPNELYQMFHASNIANHRDSVVKHRDSLIKHRDSVVKHRDSLLKHRDSLLKHRDSVVKHRDSLLKRLDKYIIYSNNRYEKLYYSEWATFGRLGKLEKILYLIKKFIKYPVKLLFKR